MLNQNNNNELKINIDIYYSEHDITSLRWLNEIHKMIQPYQKFININEYPIETANQLIIQTDTIKINKKKINFSDMDKSVIEIIQEIIYSYSCEINPKIESMFALL